MARNPRSDMAHKHNALVGSVAMAKSAMQSVTVSGTCSTKAKEEAAILYGRLDDLQREIKNNPTY